MNADLSHGQRRLAGTQEGEICKQGMRTAVERDAVDGGGAIQSNTSR